MLKYDKKQLPKVKFFEEGESVVEAILEANFEGKGWAKAGQSITATVHNEEQLELNTYI